MRTVNSDIVNALNNQTAYRTKAKLLIYPSRVFFETADYVDLSGAIEDSAGIQEEPALTDFISINELPLQFYNDAGTLKYQYGTQNSLTTVSPNGTISGKPGTINVGGTGYIFFVSSGTLYRYTLDETAMATPSGDILDSQTSIATGLGSDVIVHAIDDTACVLLWSDEGGIRATLYLYDSTWNAYEQENRFMFPVMYDYTEGDAGNLRSFFSMACFSGAAMMDGNVYVYISNALTGGVDGVIWNGISQTWGDIFPAVAADLKASICEFRVANCISYGGRLLLCGQFRRNENIDTELSYTMILRSDTGKLFSMDSFSLVSDHNYRQFLAMENDNTFMLSACFTIAKTTTPPWLYTSVSPTPLTISDTHLLEISDTDLATCNVSLAIGDLTYYNAPELTNGSKVVLQLGYATSNDIQYETYGTYILDRIRTNYANGNYQLLLSLTNLAQWQLQGMTSPFYTEIISKSSAIDKLASYDETQLYIAELTGFWETKFSVDAWSFEEYADTGIAGLSLSYKSGPEYKRLVGAHTAGVKTKDLKEALSSEDYPTCNTTSITVNIYGWSYTEADVANDEIRLRVFVERDGEIQSPIESTGKRWARTYTGSAAGDYPIVYTPTVQVGDKIRYMALVIVSDNTTNVLPVRIDVTAGVDIYYTAANANTGWYSVDDLEWKVRGKNYPNIMLSRQPYDSFNFMVAAEFEDNLSGYLATYGPVGWGLVGLAQNAKNYVVGRYNHVNDRIEIVKVRNGAETILAYATATGDLSSGGKLMFTHKDGTFRVYAYINSVWEPQLTYEWTATDGWMFTDTIAAKHTGIYGYINVPSFRICGYSPGSDPGKSFAYGIPVLPGDEQFSYFPESGSVEIGDRVYSYGAKCEYTEIRGPFQFRQRGQYQAPYGNGSYGLHCLDFDRSKTNGDYTGYLMAVDEGTVYLLLGSDWTAGDGLEGQYRDLPGRTLYYGDKTIIMESYHGCNNKIYITGGLISINQTGGELTEEYWGESCYLHTTGDIKLKGYWGSSGDIDVTVRDLIYHIATSSGAPIQFNGDVSETSIAVTAETPENVGTIPYGDGFDLYFTSPELTGTEWIGVVTNANFSALTGYESDTGILVKLERATTEEYLLSLISVGTGETTIDKIRLTLSDLIHNFRVLFHGDFITIYSDDIWLYTFHTESVTYPNNVSVSLTAGQNETFTDILLPELCDWREAIYIDLETDGMAAIGSVIQERPVEIYCRYNGDMSFCYEPVRQTNNLAVYPRSHSLEERRPDRGASDAIIYFSEVSTVLNAEYRKKFGFATRMYRMPNLEKGAARAAKVQLDKNFRDWRVETIDTRPDIRIELGDKLSVVYDIPGTTIEKSVLITVDNIRLSLRSANSSMNINGKVING